MLITYILKILSNFGLIERLLGRVNFKLFVLKLRTTVFSTVVFVLENKARRAFFFFSLYFLYYVFFGIDFVYAMEAEADMGDIQYWQAQADYCKEVLKEQSITENERKQAREELKDCMNNIRSSIKEQKEGQVPNNTTDTSNNTTDTSNNTTATTSTTKRKAQGDLNPYNKRVG
jgi:hypothetical protein